MNKTEIQNIPPQQKPQVPMDLMSRSLITGGCFWYVVSSKYVSGVIFERIGDGRSLSCLEKERDKV